MRKSSGIKSVRSIGHLYPQNCRLLCQLIQNSIDRPSADLRIYATNFRKNFLCGRVIIQTKQCFMNKLFLYCISGGLHNTPPYQDLFSISIIYSSFEHCKYFLFVFAKYLPPFFALCYTEPNKSILEALCKFVLPQRKMQSHYIG